MSAALLTAGPVVVVALGAYVRWAVRPVRVAFRIGRHVGRMR